MAAQETETTSRPGNRTLVIAAAGVWLVVVILAAFLLLTAGGESGDEASAGPTTSLPVASAQVTAAARVTTTTTVAPTTSSTTTSSTTTSTLPPPLTVAAGGDVMGDRGPGNYMDAHGGASVFAKVTPYFEKAQLAFVNLEGPISNVGARQAGKEYTFRARTALADGLVSAGIDVVSMANNHVLDYGQAALKDCLLRLNRAGVAHAGAGLNSTSAAAPAMLVTRAGSVSVLAYTSIIPGGFAATSSHGGVNPVTEDHARIVKAIKAAAKKTDFVVVSVHWGTEYKSQANSEQRALAHQMIDAGADLIIGHHPHVIQGLEVYHDKLIAYSLGDFVFDHWSRATGEAFILQVSLRDEGPPAVNIVPVYVGDSTGVPAAVTGDEADAILGRLVKLSANLGLKLVQNGARATLADDPVVDQ
jgi:poly-gamma-glutamate capsule biosynthesis protein CapA/YwtB (metallophosphatase superfamily)